PAPAGAGAASSPPSATHIPEPPPRTTLRPCLYRQEYQFDQSKSTHRSCPFVRKINWTMHYELPENVAYAAPRARQVVPGRRLSHAAAGVPGCDIVVPPQTVGVTPLRARRGAPRRSAGPPAAGWAVVFVGFLQSWRSRSAFSPPLVARV